VLYEELDMGIYRTMDIHTYNMNILINSYLHYKYPYGYSRIDIHMDNATVSTHGYQHGFFDLPPSCMELRLVAPHGLGIASKGVCVNSTPRLSPKAHST